MTLPRKVILIIVASMIILAVLFYAASLNVILEGASTIEQRNVAQDVNRVNFSRYPHPPTAYAGYL